MGDAADAKIVAMREASGGRTMGGQEAYAPVEDVESDIKKFKGLYEKVQKKYGGLIQEEVDRRNAKITKDAESRGTEPRLLDPALVIALIAKESGGRRMAESKPSPEALARYGTAKGLTQMIDDTARRMGVTDVYDERQSIRGGIKYLTQMIERFDGDQKKALAAYNCGPGCVDSFVAGKRSRLPRETRRYVTVIENIRPPTTPAPTDVNVFDMQPQDIEFKRINPLEDIAVEEVTDQ